MSKRRIPLPTPAVVIAILALVAGLSGVAMAGPSAKKVTTKKVKKIATKVSDQEIAANGNPIAYAHILKDGTVVAAESRNFSTANVTKRPAASYCLSGLPAFKSVSVTPDYINDVDEQTDKSAQVGLPGSGFVAGCSGVAGLQAEIATNVDSTYVHHGIYVQLFN